MTPREFLDWAEQLRHMNGELVLRNPISGDFESFDPPAEAASAPALDVRAIAAQITARALARPGGAGPSQNAS